MLVACDGAAAKPAPRPSPSIAVTAAPSPSPSPSPTPTPVSQQTESPLPLPRQEVASAVLPGNPDTLFVIGGFDPQRRSSSDVQWLVKGSWAAAPAYPFPVDHASAATAGGHLYVAGGNSNGAVRADLYQLDPSTNSGWLQLAPMHHARGALALVASGRFLYALGGIAGAEVAPVEAYDTIQNTWTDVATLPVPRDHGAGFGAEGKICLAGGRSPNTARVDCFDPASNTWSRLPDLPVPTSGAGAAGQQGEVIVAGGEDAAEGRLVDHVFRLGPGDSAWKDEPMLIPRHGIELVSWGSRAWACGGATAPGYQASGVCTSLG